MGGFYHRDVGVDLHFRARLCRAPVRDDVRNPVILSWECLVLRLGRRCPAPNDTAMIYVNHVYHLSVEQVLDRRAEALFHFFARG